MVLSDDDDDDDKWSRTEMEKLPRRLHRKNAIDEAAAVVNDRPPLSPVDTNCTESSDDDYVERVLRWLHKPSDMLDARRKPMSAPSVINDAASYRRPALVKTCLILENKFDDQQVVEIATDDRPVKSNRNRTKNHHKTELHVHMPSVCPTGNVNNNCL